jgi:gliding motility-associated-like protein
MKQLKSFLIILCICGLSSKVKAQYISVDDQKTPQQLIEGVLVNNSCAAASNSTGLGDNFRPGNQSFAYFNNNGSSFPFTEGIVLATSTGQSAIGPFVSALVSNDSPNWRGDSDLDQTLGISSINATALEFDFVASANSLSFNYIFASNEYQFDYPCQYSDGFAFLIKETGTNDPYKNIAVLPNTTTPVSSVNIRPKVEPGTRPGGIAYSGCEASNAKYFNGFNNNTSPVNYAGQTVIMTAQASVTAGKKYHVKLVIADDRNRNLESAIFLEAGSFASKITLGQDRTIATNNPACFGEKVLLDTQLQTSDYDFKWYKKDNPTTILSTNATYEVLDAGTYKVEAKVKGTACIALGEIKIEYAPEIPSTDISLFQCDDNADGINTFNLTKVDNLIKNNVAENLNKGYYETLADAQSKTNIILNPQKYTNKSVNQVIFGRIEDKYGCYKTPQITLRISNNPIVPQNPVATCDGDTQDGLYQFDLNAQVTPRLSGLPNGSTVNYFASEANAIAETNQLPNIFKNTTAFNQTIYIRIINGPDCYNITPITLVVNTFDPPNFEDEFETVCKGSQLTLSVATGFASYLWNTGSTSNSIIVNAGGDYSVTVKDVNGCEKTKKFKVNLSEPPVITDAIVKDFSADENSVQIKFTGTGDYEFSLDGTVFQDDPTFTGIKPGVYNAVGRDKNGCGLSNSFLFYVLDYPRFFTPNDDGYNDLWTITRFDQLPNYNVFIFDRYGKFIKQFNQNSSGWNGQFNGQKLSSDDYWFTLIFENGKNIKGHFSLKR